VGQSAAIQALQAQIRRLTAFDTVDNPHAPTLLLQGETGTGKGLVARVIHDSGPRVQGPYIEVNCAAIPETMLEAELFGFEAGAFTDARRAKPGLFETASGGTLFLDEIDELPLGLQAKLLTALEEKHVRRLGAVATRQVDVKIITATQAVLTDRVAAGGFRADLYHRLAVVQLHLPPLRTRGKDVLVLAEYFLRRYAAAHQLSPKRLTRAAHAWLLAQVWPGNVRELNHLLERATLLHPGAVLDAHALEQLRLTPPSSPLERTAAADQPLDEAAQLQRALVQAQGNVVRAARLLGISRSAMRYRMRRYQIGGSASLAGRRATPEAAGSARSPAIPPPEGETRVPRAEQKPVALLAISLTLPPPGEGDTHIYEPWTTAHRLERSIVEKVQGFGGVVLPGPPVLRLVAFGIPRALEQMPRRAVQAALAIRHLVAEAAPMAGGLPCPQVRCAVQLGEVLADTQLPPSQGDVLLLGDTLTHLLRLLGLAAPGDILLAPQVGRVVQDWFTLQTREPAAYLLTADKDQRSLLTPSE
jgi:transcriptional regulator with AAA-type ATPase domain